MATDSNTYQSYAAAAQDKKILRLTSLKVRLDNYLILNQQDRESKWHRPDVMQLKGLLYDKLIKQLKVSKQNVKYQFYITIKA